MSSELKICCSRQGSYKCFTKVSIVRVFSIVRVLITMSIPE